MKKKNQYLPYLYLCPNLSRHKPVKTSVMLTTYMSIIQGEQGVIEVLELLKQELRLAMALSGKTHQRK